MRPGTIQLDHLNLFVADLASSRAFYESVLSPFGYEVVKEYEDIAVGFGDGDYAVLALLRAKGEIQPTHLAFRVDRRSDVDRFHSIAMNAGAADNGPPGRRPHSHANYYAAFVLDPDGHNLEFVCHDPGG